MNAQQAIEDRILCQCRLIAECLAQDKGLLEQAKSNLERWEATYRVESVSSLGRAAR